MRGRSPENRLSLNPAMMPPLIIAQLCGRAKRFDG